MMGQGFDNEDPCDRCSRYTERRWRTETGMLICGLCRANNDAADEGKRAYEKAKSETARVAAVLDGYSETRPVTLPPRPGPTRFDVALSGVLFFIFGTAVGYALNAWGVWP